MNQNNVTKNIVENGELKSQFLIDWKKNTKHLSSEFIDTIADDLDVKSLGWFTRTFKSNEHDLLAQLNPQTGRIQVTYNTNGKTRWADLERHLCYMAVGMISFHDITKFYKAFRPVVVQFINVILVTLYSQSKVKPYSKNAAETITDLMISFESGRIDGNGFVRSIRPLYGTYTDGSFVWDTIASEPDTWLDYATEAYFKASKSKSSARIFISPDSIIYPSHIVASFHSLIPTGVMKPLHNAVTKLLK